MQDKFFIFSLNRNAPDVSLNVIIMKMNLLDTEPQMKLIKDLERKNLVIAVGEVPKI